MRVLIDNLDGHGIVDYSSAVAADSALRIERTLNGPSRCALELLLAETAQVLPARKGRVTVCSDAGTVLFTGYIATTPDLLFAGDAMGEPVYRTAVNALSDDWLLDRQELAGAAQGLSQPASSLLRSLTTRTGAGTVATGNLGTSRNIGVFTPDVTKNWSHNAGVVAAAAYSGYRVVSGALNLISAGATTHTFRDTDGTLMAGAIRAAQAKELANDITVTGEIEPTAYVTELFEGDGTTAVFKLSASPFRPHLRSGGGVLLNDSFQEGTLNQDVWTVNDPGSALALSASGLAMNGGNGQDGGTTLSATGAIEMGGTLLVEVGGVTLSGASNAVLGGFYSGAPSRQSCVAGFDVQQLNGATTVTPIIHGADAGTSIALLNGHTYTLRMRLHCPESQRVGQIYYSMSGGVVESFGGGLASAAMSVVLEVQDLGSSSNTPATVLYDGTIASTPAVCSFSFVSAEQVFGSINFCRVTQQGSLWMTSTAPSSQTRTRLTGVAGEGVDCHVSGETITFFSGRIPVAGEVIRVTYRSAGRAVARLQDAASIASETAAGLNGRAQWMGRVNSPVARSSADCEQAAAALLALATSADAAMRGEFRTANPPEDVWPGDVLAITQSGQTRAVMVRKAVLVNEHALPELVRYDLEFANDWAESLGIQVSSAIAVDAVVPESPISVPGAGVLANLSQLQVVATSATTLQIDAGTVPPAGGGFEVRRRDGAFSPSSDQDLVLRSPVRTFSIPRAAQAERYYIRQYDASVPPLYSRHSSAVVTNLPVS